MKTSVIEVHDLLSVLSVDEVEKRIGDVPGVKSNTVNYSAGSVTVRFDETRLEIADIRSAVRLGLHESAPPAAASAHENHKANTAAGSPLGSPASAAPKTPHDAASGAGAAAAAELPDNGPANGPAATQKPLARVAAAKSDSEKS